MNNPFSLDQNVFEYIDSLQDEKSANELGTLINANNIVSTFWQAFANFFKANSAL